MEARKKMMRNVVPKGAKVRYTGASDSQVRWGGNDDPRGVLTEGEIYIVESTEIHSSHTKVKLKGIPGKFNSVSFEEVQPTEAQVGDIYQIWLDVALYQGRVGSIIGKERSYYLLRLGDGDVVKVNFEQRIGKIADSPKLYPLKFRLVKRGAGEKVGQEDENDVTRPRFKRTKFV